jgi:hypothetical protein
MVTPVLRDVVKWHYEEPQGLSCLQLGEFDEYLPAERAELLAGVGFELARGEQGALAVRCPAPDVTDLTRELGSIGGGRVLTEDRRGFLARAVNLGEIFVSVAHLTEAATSKALRAAWFHSPLFVGFTDASREPGLDSSVLSYGRWPARDTVERWPVFLLSFHHGAFCEFFGRRVDGPRVVESVRRVCDRFRVVLEENGEPF